MVPGWYPYDAYPLGHEYQALGLSVIFVIDGLVVEPAGRHVSAVKPSVRGAFNRGRGADEKRPPDLMRRIGDIAGRCRRVGCLL